MLLKLVETVISSTLAENTVDENVTVRKVAVPKDTTSTTGSMNVIKTTSVTTGTDKIEKLLNREVAKMTKKIISAKARIQRINWR